MLSTVLGFVLGVVIVVLVFATLVVSFEFGVHDFIVDGMNHIAELIGSGPAYIILALFGLGFATLIVRFILSWIGENPGSSANK